MSSGRRELLQQLLGSSLHAQRKGKGGELALMVWKRPDGGKVVAAFTTREKARAWNGDPSADWVEVPAVWVFGWAARSAEGLIVDLPHGLELSGAELAALAAGRLPDVPPPPAEAPLAAATAPAPLPAAASEPAAPRWTIGPPAEVPPEALEYLRVVLESIDEVSEAWFFDARTGPDEETLCLGLKVELPPAEWDGLIEGIEQFDDVPGLEDGLAISALDEKTLAAVRRVGLRL